MDFTKFLSTITGGGGPIGPGATVGGAPAAYYWNWDIKRNRANKYYSINCFLLHLN